MELGAEKGIVTRLYATALGFRNGHACSLFHNGTVQCWGRGYNSGGVVGLGPSFGDWPGAIMNTDRIIPILGRVVDMATFREGWYALLSDGNVLALGSNGSGQLGLGHTINRGFTENASLVEFSSVGSWGNPIVARFEHASGASRKQIKFDAATSFSQFAATYSWDFGDMMTGTGESVTHTYAKAGTYTVTLTATDSEGQTDTFTATVTVEADNTAPFFYNAAQTFTAAEGMANAIDLEAGMDSEGDSLTYTLVDAPAEGTLANCLGDSTDLSCDYTPATGTTTTNVSFTYKANDGNLDSLEVFTVFLEIE